MKQKFTVTGMTCSACSAHVDKAVRKLEGVSDQWRLKTVWGVGYKFEVSPAGTPG